jgi:Anti-sigma-K factor rskA
MEENPITIEGERDAAARAERGPRADRPPRGRHQRPLPGRRLLASVAATVLAAGVLAGFVIAGSGDGSRTYQATIDPAKVDGASAELRVEDGEATLVAEGLPEPDGSFQVWIKRPGIDSPEPSMLFLPRNGSAVAAVPQVVDDAEAVLVTDESKAGSEEPSEAPVLTIPIS